MGYHEDTALDIENRQAHVYQMNECDWWCDYSQEEAKENYIKFTGITEDNFEEPEKFDEEQLNKYKYTTEDDRRITFLSASW